MIVKVVAVGLIGALLAVLFKREHPEYAYLISLTVGVLIILLLYDDLGNVVRVFQSLAKTSGLSDGHVILLLKVLGIAYLSQFGAALASDCGEKSIAEKIEFAGKVFIIALSTPLFIALIEAIADLV